MSNKKLYWQLSTPDGSQITGSLDGAMQWIMGEMDDISEINAYEYEYALKPFWLTEDEYDNLLSVVYCF